MLPRGEIWQSLRTCALMAVPSGAMLRSAEPATLADWLAEGSYTADRPSRERFVLHGSAQDVGAALLGDATLYLDASLEHAYALRYALKGGGWTSDGWSVVGVYYWAFYLITAWGRLLGRTSVFLDDVRARALADLSGGQPVAGGTYRLSVAPSQDAGRVTVEVRKSGASRVHDASWRAWIQDLRSVVRVSRTDGGAGDEIDYYEALLKPFNSLGETWPSDLRNAANYGPKFGYRAVRRVTSAFDLAQLRSESTLQFDDCLGRLRQNANALTRSDVRAQSRLATRVLLDMTCLLHETFGQLYKDVLERRQVDQRWANLRTRFNDERNRSFALVRWPLDGV